MAIQVQSPEILRRALLATTGAAIVGVSKGGDAQSKFDSLDLKAGRSSAAPASTVDLYYGVCKGAGFLVAEVGGDLIYDVSVISLAGSKTVTLTANASTVGAVPLLAGQLFTYLGDDGEYYTSVIDSIAVNVLTLSVALEVDISVGETVFNFYNNEAHPNIYGYNAIADFALRTPKKNEKEVRSSQLKVRLAASSVALVTNTSDNPGSASVAAIDVTSPGANSDGLIADLKFDNTGAYEIHVAINTLGNNVKLSWSLDGQADFVIINNNAPELVKLPVYPFNSETKGSLYVFGTSAAINFYIAEYIKIVEITPIQLNLDGGKHVLLGDSWFSITPGIIDRMQVRLPNATFVNAGMGGNRAADSVGRFAADVVPENPDFVWYITGTNDYFGLTTTDIVGYNINKLKSLCSDIGAQLLMFNSSVGSAEIDAARFNLSRRYAHEVTYNDKKIKNDLDLKIISINFTVAAGVDGKLLDFGRYLSPGFLLISEYFLSHVCTVDEATGLGASAGVLETLTTALTTTDLQIAPSGGSKFLQLRYDNTGGGAAVTVHGYLIVSEGFVV